MWAIAGEPLTYHVDFKVDDEFVVPSSATATLRDHVGAVLWSGTALTIEGTGAAVEIAAPDLTLGAGALTENRYLVVNYQVATRWYREEYFIRLRAAVPLRVKPADVRRHLGLDMSELPDEDIDVFEAYLLVMQEHGDIVGPGLLTSDHRNVLANRAVALRAAIDIVPSLWARAGTQWSSEESKFQRMSEFDLDQIKRGLSDHYASCIAGIQEAEEVIVSSFLLATPTDPITGA